MAIYIKTNQNVNIEYEICSISSRINALLIDSLVMFGITIALIYIFSFLSDSTKGTLFWIVIAIPIFFYHLISELTMNGQSIGKRVTKIKVIKANGSQASFSHYFLRFLFRPLDSFYALGLACIFFTKKNQRIGDLAAGTIMITVKDAISFKDIDKTMSVSNDAIVYPEVEKLKDSDIAIIIDLLEKRKTQQNHENIVLLAKKIQDHLFITTHENPYTFLTIIVRD